MARSKKRGKWLSTPDAAERLGVTVPLFRQFVGLDPGELTVAGVETWMHPMNVARAEAKRPTFKWLRKDVDCLAHILERRQAAQTTSGLAGAEEAEPEEPDDDPPGAKKR